MEIARLESETFLNPPRAPVHVPAPLPDPLPPIPKLAATPADRAGRIVVGRVSYTAAELAALGVRWKGRDWEAAIRHPGGKVCTADFPTAGAALSFVQAVARARGET